MVWEGSRAEGKGYCFPSARLPYSTGRCALSSICLPGFGRARTLTTILTLSISTS